MIRRIAVFAQPPLPGRARMRLAPVLTPALACEFHRACIADVLDAARAVAADERFVYWTQPAAEAAPPAGFTARQQAGADPGARLMAAFDELLAAPDDRALVLGAGCPEIGVAYLARAFDALDTNDIALGPAVSGSGCLLALRRPQPRLFEGIEWGTPRVIERARANAAAAGLGLALLDPLEKLETPAELARFIARACATSGDAVHARRMLAGVGLLPATAAP
jgi:glycosyltransferase A (GT-A) superfamily protein (DUF2064 family)